MQQQVSDEMFPSWVCCSSLLYGHIKYKNAVERGVCIYQTIFITCLLHHLHSISSRYALLMVYDSVIWVICVCQTFIVMSWHDQVVRKSIRVGVCWYAKEASVIVRLLCYLLVSWYVFVDLSGLLMLDKRTGSQPPALSCDASTCSYQCGFFLILTPSPTSSRILYFDWFPSVSTNNCHFLIILNFSVTFKTSLPKMADATCFVWILSAWWRLLNVLNLVWLVFRHPEATTLTLLSLHTSFSVT